MEETFAVDASGMSSSLYSRWVDYRFTNDRRYHDWLKVHIIVGTKSAIITDIVVTDGHSHDSPYFPILVENTSKFFNMREVSADPAYSSKHNLQVATDIGALPLIPFKKNVTGKARGSKVWCRMFLYYQLHQEDFMRLYHKRSNVESAFSTMKRKFGG